MNYSNPIFLHFISDVICHVLTHFKLRPIGFSAIFEVIETVSIFEEFSALLYYNFNLQVVLYF